MKFNFRKVASVLASVAMLGSSIGIAAAANYPSPFVQGGVANVAVVAGSSAAISDWAAVTDIGISLQEELAKQTAVSSSSSGATASGGDSKNLGTSSRRLYYGDSINNATTTVSSSDMPTVLTDGTFTDLAGTKYTYSQTITVGTADIRFGTSGGDLDDPVLYLNVGTTAGALYNYTLALNKNVNVTDATNVQGQKINIMGVDYVIGASSTNTTLYLYGSGVTAVVNSGTAQTVTVGDTSHTVELVSTSSATAGTIKVDGVSKSVVEGSNYGFSGGLNVYVKDIIHPAYAGDLRQAELIIGASSLKLANGQSVKIGADETTIRGTSATLTAAGPGQISAIKVSVALPKSDNDDIAIGESFTDPVFGGLKVQFADVVPDLNSSTRETIKVDTDNSQYAYVTFTSDRSGVENKLTYVYDNLTSASTVEPELASKTISSNKGLIHVYEGENANEDDWIVVNKGDAGTIIEVEDIDIASGDTTGTVTLRDVLSDESQTLTLTNTSGVFTKTATFAGETGYTVSANNGGTTVNITWNSGTRALFPRIKLSNGGWITFLKSTVLTPGANVLLPSGTTNLATSGVVIPADNGTALNYTSNGITWQYDNNDENTTVTVRALAAPACNYNTTKGPAILYIEPKKWDDSSQGNFICIPLTTTGTTEIAVGTPVFNGTNSGFITLNSDTYKQEAVDQFGTYVSYESRTNENGVATIKYTNSQMYFDVLFTSPSAVVSGGSSGGGSVTGLGSVTVSDSEYSQVSSKNLIVVGGSCINSVAAKLLGESYCGADFETATSVGAGSFLIQSFDNPDASGKVALLVAGYDAADTTNAVSYLLDQAPDTAVGNKYVGTSATSATLVTA